MTNEQKDIVARLRKQSVGDYNALWWDEAADAIERLRAELVSKADELEATVRELRKVETECSMLRVECGLLERNAETTYENHKRIVAELTAERDEARRAWIMFFCNEGLDMDPNARVWPDDPEMLEAARRGWDCFKEDKR
jgi:hypothetical protein